MGISKRLVCMLILLTLTISTAVYSQQRETVSITELLRIQDIVQEVADEIAELRRNMDSDQAAKLFLQKVAESQKRLEPAIISIAETNAPKEAQLYAISLAIATKEAELSLWHYINAFVSNQEAYLKSADVFLQESLKELSKAARLAPAAE